MIETNRIIQGDCLHVLAEMPPRSVDLVYLDPPFFTQTRQTLKSRELTAYSFNDTWRSMSAYIEFLRERIQQVARVMADNATIFVHCDRNASHYIRVLLDEVFGYERFRSEIIWTYRRWSNSKRALLPSHQTIFMYAKSDGYTFNEMRQPYSETTNLDQILQKRERNTHGKSVYATDAQGDVILNGPKQGVPLSDTWAIPYLNPKARERTGYPTQKPLLLLERIVALASNVGDVVLDPFCGSGTTCVAASLLDRRYIGIDVSSEAVTLSEERIKNPVRSDSDVMKKGRKAYQNLPREVVALLEPMPVKLVQRNSGIDAIHDVFIAGRPVVIRVQRANEPLGEAVMKLHQAGQRKQAALMLLVRTDDSPMQVSFTDVWPDDVVIVDALALQVEAHIEQHIARVVD